MNPSIKLATLIEDSLRFDFMLGCVSRVTAPYTTGWRTLPCAIFNQWQHARVLVEVENGPSVTADDGQGILTGTGVRHRLTLASKGNATCRWAHMNGTVLEALDAFSLLDMPLLTDRASADTMGNVCEELFALQSPGDDLSLGVMARRKELAFKLFAAICSVSTHDLAGIKMIGKMRRVLPCLTLIQREMAGSVTREVLAAAMGLSPTRFHTVFRRATGMAPMRYVRQFRIRHAQRLLLDTTLSVAEVGARIGFSDPFHFSRMFKTAIGKSPGAYRQEIKKSIRAV
jgi:AraC-like DNA-binding protein